MKYLNLKTNYGIETVDSLNSLNFSTYKEFKTELLRLVKEYRLCNMNVYISQRACKNY